MEENLMVAVKKTRKIGDGTPGPGRPRGVANKTTTRVREAIALIAERQAPEVEKWLRQVRDPARRVELFLRLIEYHIPKLQRSEVVGEKRGPVNFSLRVIGVPAPRRSEE
jgi:hypothetical protein